MSAVTRPHDPDAQLLHALADPMRLAIVRQLAAERETCACDLTVGIELVRSRPSPITFASCARRASSSAERRGTWVYYTLEPAPSSVWLGSARELTPASLGAALRRRRGEALAGRRLPVLGPETQAPSLRQQLRRHQPAQRAAAGTERPRRVDAHEGALAHAAPTARGRGPRRAT